MIYKNKRHNFVLNCLQPPTAFVDSIAVLFGPALAGFYCEIGFFDAHRGIDLGAAIEIGAKTK